MFIDASKLKELLENLNPEYVANNQWGVNSLNYDANMAIQDQERKARLKEEFDLRLIDDIYSVLMNGKNRRFTLLDIRDGLVAINADYRTISLQAITRRANNLGRGEYRTRRYDEGGNRIVIPLEYRDGNFKVCKCKMRCSDGVKSRYIQGYIITDCLIHLE